MPLTVMLSVAVSRHEHPASAQEGAGTQTLTVQQDGSQGKGETEHPKGTFSPISPYHSKSHSRICL